MIHLALNRIKRGEGILPEKEGVRLYYPVKWGCVYSLLSKDATMGDTPVSDTLLMAKYVSLR